MTDKDIADWLKTEQDEQVQWARLVWTEYMKWFAFFCGLNITALGALRFIDTSIQPYIEFVLMSLNLGGILSTFFVASYSRRIFDTVTSISDRRAKISSFMNEDRIPISIPLDLAAWISFSAFTTFLLFISIWVSFIFSSTSVQTAVQAIAGGWCSFAILLSAILVLTGLSARSFVSAVLAERHSLYKHLVPFLVLGALDLVLLVWLSLILIPGQVP